MMVSSGEIKTIVTERSTPTTSEFKTEVQQLRFLRVQAFGQTGAARRAGCEPHVRRDETEGGHREQ